MGMPNASLTKSNEDVLNELEIIETHVGHRRDRVMGYKAPGANTFATNDSLTAFGVTSAAGAYGTEVQVLGTADTPVISGKTQFDPGRINVTNLGTTDPFVFRFVYGSGTFTNAVAANQYSEVVIHSDISKAQVAGGVPIPIGMPKCTSGVCKMWAQAKNAGNAQTVGFFYLIHEY